MPTRPYPILTVNEKAARSLRAGHPWVYGAETTGPDQPYQNGDIVDVVSHKGRWLGAGVINDHSKIRVRLLSRNTNDRFDEAFWRRRIQYALDYRKTVMGPDFACSRLIFGEADHFPGLTVDLFQDILVTEVLSLGMEVRKHILYPLLVELLKDYGVTVRAIYERNDSPSRTKEGLDRVLDCCTHTGAFALNCAQAGAEHVTAVDISKDAVELTRRNAALNGLSDKVEVQQADVFDLLTTLAQEKKHPYDYIILDPPAFTKSGATVKNAYRGYKEINLKAMKLLPRGGYLATCSCSHFMTPALFCQMLREAAADAAVSLRQIEDRRQSPDHPILWGVPETEYLKFYLFQIV